MADPLLLCRRLSVDLTAVAGCSLTIWQPSLQLASGKETVISSGLTSLNFMSGAVPTFFRCSDPLVTIHNGITTVNGIPADATLAAAGWVSAASLDSGLPIIVTPAGA